MTSHIFIEASVKVNVSRCVLPCHVIHDADINPRCNDVTRLSEPEFQHCRVRLRHIHVNKFEKLVHLSFTIEIYHDARPYRCQTLTLLLTHSHCAPELETVQHTECDVTVT